MIWLWLACSAPEPVATEPQVPDILVSAAKAVSEARGLPLEVPPHQVLTPEQVAEEMEDAGNDHPELMARLDAVHGALGVTLDQPPEGFQMAAFYRPDTGRIVFIGDLPTDPAVLHHELTHALQHQRLGAGLPDPSWSLDAMWSRAWLREGEAVLVAYEVLHGPGTARLANTADLGHTMPSTGPDDFAMRYHMATALLPYALGSAAVQGHLHDGWSGVDAVWATDPVGVEALTRRNAWDPPWTVQLELELPEGWSAGGGEVLGFAGITALSWAARPRAYPQLAAHGWEGDRFVPLHHDDGRAGFVWRSRWESEADATNFAEEVGAWWPDDVSASVEHRGLEVLAVRGPTSRSMNEEAWAAAFVEGALPQPSGRRRR